MKPGDIVMLDIPKCLGQWRYPAWKEMNGNGPFIITGPMYPGDEINMAIRHLDGAPIAWDAVKFGAPDPGISNSWLKIEEFLTAARKAIADETR